MVAVGVGHGHIVERRMEVLEPDYVSSFMFKSGHLDVVRAVFLYYHSSGNDENLIDFGVFSHQVLQVLEDLRGNIFVRHTVVDLILGVQLLKQNMLLDQLPLVQKLNFRRIEVQLLNFSAESCFEQGSFPIFDETFLE
jgi:hypothetical protein